MTPPCTMLPWTAHRWIAALMLALAAVACSEDANEDAQNNNNNACDPACASGQVCQDGQCVTEEPCQGASCDDAGVNNTGEPDAQNNTSTPDAQEDPKADAPDDAEPDADVTEDVPQDAAPDTQEDTPEDADLPEDVQEDTDVAQDVPQDADVEEPDLPLEPRPEVLEGGVSLFEAVVRVNTVLGPRYGGVAASFVEPGMGGLDIEPEGTFGPCDVLPSSDEELAENLAGYDAGDITIDVESFPRVTLSPTQQEEGGLWLYGSDFSEDEVEVFEEGLPIEIRSRGGRHIRGFTVLAEGPPTHLVRMPPPAGRVMGGGPLSIAWDGENGPSDVYVTISTLGANFLPVGGRALSCRPAGDTGTLEVPAEALAQLAGPKLLITVIKVWNQEFEAGQDRFVLNMTVLSVRR